MMALVKEKRGAGHVSLKETTEPSAGPGQVMVRVKAAGICHTDEHYRAGDAPVARLPLTLGHEVAGVVERVGRSVAALRPGDRVCVHYLAFCGVCASCRSGASTPPCPA